MLAQRELTDVKLTLPQIIDENNALKIHVQ